MRRVRRGSIASDLLMCGRGVLLPLVARCLETIVVCMYVAHVLMIVVVTVWDSVVMFVV